MIVYRADMSSFNRVALVQSHQRIQPPHVYYLADLVELCGLAAAIEPHVDSVDLPVSPSDRDPLAALSRYLRKYSPDLVGISTFTCGARSAREYADIAARSGATVVVGGYHPTALPEEVLSWPGVDVVVRGEGEATLREFVQAGSPVDVDGMSFRVDGQTIRNPDRPVIDDLDELPLPLRELRPERFGLEGYDYHTDTIFASRGCRGKCRFCANKLVGKRWRGRSNESILTELLSITPLRKGTWKYVKFWDSNFLTDTEKVEELALLLIEHGLERCFRFIVETRVEDVVRSAAILPIMRQASFVRIGCGIESPKQETLKDLHKGINLAHVQRAADLVTEANMQFSKFLIIGHPNESEEDILAYPDYALSHGVELQKTTFFVMTPYPGTELAEEYAEKGQIVSTDWDLYTNYGAVVELGQISSLRLQTLFCATAAEYGIARRFLAGKSFLRSLGQLYQALLLHAKVGLLNQLYTREEVETSLMDALAVIARSRLRVRSRREKQSSTDRIQLCFHGPDRRVVTMHIDHQTDREELVFVLGSGERKSSKRRRVHLSTRHLMALADRINVRRLSHAMMTLRYRPRAFRLKWVPGLLADLAAVAFVALRLTLFQLVAPIRLRRRA